MACEFITKGKKLTCLQGKGGVKNIYFALFADYGIAVANEVVTGLGTLATTFKYEVTGAVNGLTETPTTSRDNGTFFVTQVLTATFANMSAELQNELKLLMRNFVLAFVEDYNGNIHLVGLENGALASNGSKVTGLASGDLNGYTIELTAEEKEFSPLLDGATKTALLATVSNTYIA